MTIAKKRVVKAKPAKQKSAAEATLKSSYAFYLRRDELMKQYPCADGIVMFDRLLSKQKGQDSIRLTQQDLLRACVSKEVNGHTTVSSMAGWAADRGLLPLLDLSNENLKNVSFERAWLYKVSFTDGCFDKSSFAGCTLDSANFAGASVVGASFRAADAENANFAGADLTNADFTNARLNGANFSGASLDGAKFFGAERDEDDAKIPGWHLDEDGELCQIVYKRSK